MRTLNIRNFFICKNSRNCNDKSGAKTSRQNNIKIGQLSKMANPSDLLPDCTTIRSRLQKLEICAGSGTTRSSNQISQKSFLNYLQEQDQCKDPSMSEHKFVMNNSFKPKPFNKNTNIQAHLESSKSANNRKIKSRDTRFKDLLKEQHTEIILLKKQIEILTDLKYQDKWAPVQESLKHVSKFECSNCKFLVIKESFPAHISFCQEKTSTDDTSSEWALKVKTEIEPRIRNSSWSVAFHDIWNTYDKSEKNSNSHREYSEKSSNSSKRHKLSRFAENEKNRPSINIGSFDFYNKENSQYGSPTNKNNDSFINRISHTNADNILVKEDDWAATIDDYDSWRTTKYATFDYRNSDQAADSHRQLIDQETSEMIDRMQMLRSRLDSLRSPFKNRTSANSNSINSFRDHYY